MPQPQIIKLCCDFYDTPTIQTAKDVLMQTISLPDGDKRKSRRSTGIVEMNMMDIISIFCEMNPRDALVFVAHNLNNVPPPPMSINNFDISHMIEQIGNIKSKMTVLQEAEEVSLTVHATMSKEDDIASKPESPSVSPASSLVPPISLQMSPPLVHMLMQSAAYPTLPETSGMV